MTSEGAPELTSMRCKHLNGALTAHGPSRPIFEQLQSMDLHPKQIKLDQFQSIPIVYKLRKLLQPVAAPTFCPQRFRLMIMSSS